MSVFFSNKRKYSLVDGIGISGITRITQAEYDSLERKDSDMLYIIDNTLPYLIFDESEDSYIILNNFVMQKDMSYELMVRMPSPVYRGVYLTNTTNKNNYCVSCSGVGDVNWIVLLHSSSEYHAVKVNQVSAAHTFKRTPTASYLDGEKQGDVQEGTVDNVTLVLGLDEISTTKLRNTFHFFGLNIYKDGEMIHKYTPYRDENGVACIYDEVDGSYLYNSGNGSIAYERGAV